jgi:RNA polymerase sigma-70 factor (ECF subfamily)
MPIKTKATRHGASDSERFEALFDRHHKAVLGFALRRSASPDDAADAVAETFSLAWQKLDSVPDGDAARWWLYATARNTIANAHRSDRRRNELFSAVASELTQALDGISLDGDPREHVSIEVAAALATLSEEEREVLTLNAWEDLKPREIALVLGIGRAAARTRLHRARNKFIAVLGPYAAAPANAPERITPNPQEELS